MKRMLDADTTTARMAKLVATDASASRQEHELRTGQSIDNRYLVVATIGWGATGAVYLAEDMRLQRRVAIKLIHPPVAADPKLCDMFLREAESMAKVRHPNVVEVYDVGRMGGAPYLVMPYITRVHLRAWARERHGPPLPVDVMIGVVAQIAAGVGALHDVGLVHGDLKPSNILVCDGHQVVVADLGLSRVVASGQRFSLPGATPGYLAPELILNEDIPAQDAYKIDVYALGVIAYWLVVGNTPAGRGPVEQVLRRQIDRDPSPPSEVRSELPAALDPLLLSALERDPDRRPTIAEFCQSLLERRPQIAHKSPHRDAVVVIVHDDAARLATTAEIVRSDRPGIQVITMSDSTAALAWIGEHSTDLVITDLDLAGLNGVELVANLRGRASTASIPVIVATEVGGAADWRLLQSLGGVRFLLEPVDAELLRFAVAQALD